MVFFVKSDRKLDTNLNNQIEFEELTQGLAQLGFDLNLQEQYTLMRYFDKNGDWKLSMKELWEGLGGRRK